MTPLKKKYLVETTGAIGATVYKAEDPDEAVRLARRHETFVRLLRQEPKLSGKQAIAKATKYTDNPKTGLPGFTIKRVTEIKGKK